MRNTELGGPGSAAHHFVLRCARDTLLYHPIADSTYYLGGRIRYSSQIACCLYQPLKSSILQAVLVVLIPEARI